MKQIAPKLSCQPRQQRFEQSIVLRMAVNHPLRNCDDSCTNHFTATQAFISCSVLRRTHSSLAALDELKEFIR